MQQRVSNSPGDINEDGEPVSVVDCVGIIRRRSATTASGTSVKRTC